MKTILNILKIIAAIFLIIFGIWLAIFFKVNLGGILEKLFGKKINPVPNPTNLQGQEIGTVHTINFNNNPLRDKTVVELDDGTVIKLPDGIIDTDVEKIVVVSPEVIDVVKKDGTGRLTDIFND